MDQPETAERSAGPFATGAASGQPLELAWLSPIGLVGLSIANFGRRIVTLGMYDFWGRTEVRRRIWAAIRLDGEPLVYTGTGGELMTGFLVVFAILMLPVLLASFAIAAVFGSSPFVISAWQAIVFLVVTFLFGIGVYRAQRYRLARTTWRGIRGAVDGDGWRYAWTYFWTFLLIVPTLGWILPWRATRLQALVTRDMRFGDRSFRFEGGAGPLYAPFALLWLSLALVAVFALFGFGAMLETIATTVPASSRANIDDLDQLEAIRSTAGSFLLGVLVLGYVVYLLMGAWYRARMLNHFAACTRIEGLKFAGTATGTGLAWIAVSNFFILLSGAVVVMLVVALIAMALVPVMLPDPSQAQAVAVAVAPLIGILGFLSFGMMLPVTQARSTRYIVDHLSISGTIDLDRVAQRSAAEIRRGEGLSQAFDVDAF